MKKLFLVGGGTGGHCIPINVVYSEAPKNFKCFILTDNRGQKYFDNIDSNNVIILRNLISSQSRLANIINSPFLFIQSILYNFKIRPDYTIGFGGFFTIPVLFASLIMRKKIFLHEGNAFIGKANKLLFKYVGNIFTTFNETHGEKLIQNKNSFRVGLPTRSSRNLKNKETGLSGVPSGFSKLDRVTSGWQKSDLIICAARPGMGKTAFALSMARNIAIENKMGVGVFSLEMSSEQLVNRLISSESEIEAGKLRKGSLAEYEWVQLHSKIKGLSKAPIFIDDTPAISVFELRAKARRLVKKHGIKIIIIDYLQLMTAGGKGGNREQEISTISRSLKGIAKELGIPVMALSQVNRALEQRSGVGSKRPMLSDLRESGAIEQDADIVTFIYRPEYYKIQEWENGENCLGQAEIIVAKHRNGGLDNIRLKFRGQYAKFTDLY